MPQSPRPHIGLYLFLFLLLVPLTDGLPRSTVPLPFASDDIQALASTGDVHVVTYGRRIVAIDDATGALLWSVDEPTSRTMWGLTIRTDDVCATLVSDATSKVRCYALATGSPTLTLDVPKAFRLAGSASLYVGDSAGAVHAFSSTGTPRWTWRPSEPAAGVYAMAAEGGRIAAAILHDGPTGIGSGDDYIVWLDDTGQETARMNPSAGGIRRSPYALLMQGATTWVGLDGGWLMRIGPQGVVTHEVGHGAAIVALDLNGGLLAGSLLGALSLHDAQSLADAWPTFRTTDAGHVRGVHLGPTVVSAHRGGWILQTPAVAAANVLIKSPQAGDRLGAASATLSVSRQGAVADETLQLHWIAPDGARYPAGTATVTVGPLPATYAVPLSAAAIPDGTGYRLEAVLKDALGDAAGRSSGNLVVDTTPPAIVTLDPARGAVLAETPRVLVATWLDAVAGLDPDRTTLYMDGAIAPGRVVAAGQSRAEPSSVADGVHELRAVAYDRAGNRAEATWSFRLDAQPPVIDEVTVVASGSNYARLAWVTNEPAACRAGTAVTQPGAPTAGQGRLQHEAVVTGLSPQTTVVVRIACTDAAGHAAAMASQTVTTKAATGQPPALTVSAPVPDGTGGWFVTAPSIDALVRNGDLYVAIDGGASEPATSPFVAPEGDHQVQIIGFGPGGASAPWVQQIRVDTAPPTAPRVTAPKTVQSTLTLQWDEGLDDGAPVPFVDVERLDAGWTPMLRLNNPVAGAVINAEPGNHTYRLVAVDRAGNRAASDPFTVLATGTPVARMRVEAEGATTLDAGSPLRIRVLVPDAHRPFLRIVQGPAEWLRDSSPTGFQVDGLTWWAFTTPTSMLPPGTYTVQVSAPDQVPVNLELQIKGPGASSDGRVTITQRETPWPIWSVLAIAVLARRR